jgi:aryl-alcohol dehydrogenase-like predicted oxidoreductase
MTLETRFPAGDWRSGNPPIPVPLYQQIFAPGTFERHVRVAEALRPVAQRRNVSLAQLALAWVIHQDGITGVIVGSRSPTHTVEAAEAASIELTARALEEIDAAVAEARV